MLGMALTPPKGHSPPAACGPDPPPRWVPCPWGHPVVPAVRQDTSVAVALRSGQATGEVSPSPHSCAGTRGVGTALCRGAAQGQRVLPGSGALGTRTRGDGDGQQHGRETGPFLGCNGRALAAAALRGILMPQLFISRLSSYVFKYGILGVYEKIKHHLLEN